MRHPTALATFLAISLLLPATEAFAQPLKFACEAPRGKRLDDSASEKAAAAPVWVEEVLQNIHPVVTVDGETLTVTWGSTIPNPAKASAPKPTTYVFASAFRNDQSILANRIDRKGAEIFRFYFGSKTLVRLASTSGGTSADTAAPAVTAIHVADCRAQ